MRSRFGSHHSALGYHQQRQRFLLFSAIGLVFFLLVALLFVVKLKVSIASTGGGFPEVEKPEKNFTLTPTTVMVFSPEKTIPPGFPLDEVRYRKLHWPRNQVPEGAVRDLTELRGKFAKERLSPDIPIQISHLSDEPGESTLSLHPGNRAITINIDAETGIEYHVIPGSYVDVLLTHFVNREIETLVLVPNARVVSLGGHVNSTRTPLKSKTVTLEVTARDALRITASKQMGKLSLILRGNRGENAEPSPSPVNGPGVTGKQPAKVQPDKPCSLGKMKVDGKTINIDCAMENWRKKL